MMLWQKQASPAWLTANEARLEEIAGCDLAIIARPGRARSLVQVVCGQRQKAARLQRDFGGRLEALPRVWSQTMQSHSTHAPIRVGRQLEVVSEAAPAQQTRAKNQLIIPSAGAFGTGEHATTAMSLRLLEETTRELPSGWRLLDAGTGTGILALAARRLCAGEVIGLDNDPRAVAHARQNARLNSVSRARFIATDVLRWKTDARFEIVTANLFSELLVAALPLFRRALRAHGQLILSGILREQSAAVERALHRSSFHLRIKRRRGKWVALLAGL
ncbi:MAG: 50S ribosomal protein L11 methyltransferase [Chthoniobacterales bacterium]